MTTPKHTQPQLQKWFTRTAIALSASILSTMTIAGPSNGNYNDFAKVTDVRPLYETVSYREPHRECHYEERHVKGHRSSTPQILGALIGGAIGNELGHKKSNKRVGAVAGAILGGSIASDIGRNQRHSGYTKTEKVCNVSHTVRQQQQLTGYNVSYKYHGRHYQTVMDNHPGKRIRVAVDVRPSNY